MAYTDQDRIIALAGVFQAAWCAHGVAARGMADSEAMETCIHSLFQVDADDVGDVFGGTRRVAPGLRQLINQINGPGRKDMYITRYVIALLQLERKLEKEPDMLSRIGSGIEAAQARLEHYPLLHSNILAQLADIYSETVSTLQPRIMVQGEALHLQNPDNQNKIRTLLLAGIRAARLWYQTGGRRSQILFRRKKLVANAQAVLNELEA